MTRHWLFSLIVLTISLWGCFPTIEHKNPVLLDVGREEFGFYRNQYFGISMKIPDGWDFYEAKHLYPEDDRYSLNDIMVIDIDTISEKAQLVKLSGIVEQVGQSGDYPSSMQLQANHVGDFNIPDEEALANQVFESYAIEFPGFEVEKAFRKPINGRFYRIWEGKVRQNEKELSQDIYQILTKDKTYCLSFILTYEDKEDGEVLSDMIKYANWRIRD